MRHQAISVIPACSSTSPRAACADVRDKVRGKESMQDEAGRAERVLAVSLMKSGTHLIQELLVEAGYGVYGQSRIPADVRPKLDPGTRLRIAEMVHDEERFRDLKAADDATFAAAVEEAWRALGWS